MNLQTLRERRSKTVTKMRQLTETAATEDRDLDDQESKSFDEYRSKLETLESQLERAEIVQAAERTMQSETPTRGFDGTFENQCRNFSVTTAISAMLEPGRIDAGREFEISQELAHRSGRNPSGIFMPHQVFLEQRALLTSGSGGNLVPTQHRDDLLIDRLRNSLQVGNLGATILSDLSGTQDIPRLTGSASASWVAEHGAVSGSDQTFDSVPLAPKTVGAMTEYSRRMILNASPSIEQLVINDLATIVAEAIDEKALNGDGSSNTPTGIFNTAGIANTPHGTNGGAPTWADILSIISELSNDNALLGSLGWLTNPSFVKKSRSTVKITATDSSMIMESPDSLAGYTLRQSNHVRSDGSKGSGNNLSSIVFGNWADLLIGYWSAVDILVNPYETSVYSKGGVLINALQDVDIAVRHPESFSVATDVVTV